MVNIFNKYDNFTCVNIDEVLVFSKDLETHREHLQLVFKEFIKEGIIISKVKMKLEHKKLNF